MKRFVSLAVAALALYSPQVLSTSNAPDDDNTLVLLVSLSRHGSRAPNPIASRLCPKNAENMENYVVPPEQLTERGMEQLERAGQHIRDVYVQQKGFLSASFNGKDHSHFESYFRADSANRCAQSATSLAYGLYPDGTAPKGYSRQPIPVFMQLSENERDFAAAGPCWGVATKRAHEYSATRGKELIEEHAELIEKVEEICGEKFVTGSPAIESPPVAIKDVSDMFLFDLDEGLPSPPGLTPEVLAELSQLSFQLMVEKLYSNPRDITYGVAGFPSLLMRNLNDGASPTRKAEAVSYMSYHGHRELLHGLGFMIGMKFSFDGMPAYDGSTQLHPGTTMFFELHKRTAKETNVVEHIVRVYVWSPKTERQLVKLDNCAEDCPLEQFNSIITAYIQSTGTWQEICEHPQPQPSKLEAKAKADSKKKAIAEDADKTSSLVGSPDDQAHHPTRRPHSVLFPIAVLLFVVGGTVGSIHLVTRRRRSSYEAVE